LLAQIDVTGTYAPFRGREGIRRLVRTDNLARVGGDSFELSPLEASDGWSILVACAGPGSTTVSGRVRHLNEAFWAGASEISLCRREPIPSRSRGNLGGCDRGGPTPVRDVLWASAGPVDPAQATATRGDVCRGWRFPRDPLFPLELHVLLLCSHYQPSI